MSDRVPASQLLLIVKRRPEPFSFNKLIFHGRPLFYSIDSLTKRDGEDYDEYLERSRSNPIAQKVKIADLEDNMDIRRFNVLEEKDLKRLNKYLRAWKYITKEEN